MGEEHRITLHQCSTELCLPVVLSVLHLPRSEEEQLENDPRPRECSEVMLSHVLGYGHAHFVSLLVTRKFLISACLGLK